MKKGSIQMNHKEKSPWIPAATPPDTDRPIFIKVSMPDFLTVYYWGCFIDGKWIELFDDQAIPTKNVKNWMEIPE